MISKKSTPHSAIEEYFLRNSSAESKFPPQEKIKTLLVEHFPALGQLTALRFIEWVQKNPGGTVALPTGKTPEHFIKWVNHYLANWQLPETIKSLEKYGIDPAGSPEMKSLHFVQIDEFYPINPSQHNSFFYYINEFYIQGFGLDPHKAQLIDCSKIGIPPGETLDSVWPEFKVDLSLRYRRALTKLEEKQKQVLEAIDQWCQEYEQKIRDSGGIGFFLGGIGPDGHIGFNIRGSNHHSVTRLITTNYETQAAAAADLGGIEVARQRLVITIGLGTITYNPECTAIIIAAGEAKSQVVADAIQQAQDVKYPATALHILPNARFYLTKGAAKKLVQRQFLQLSQLPQIKDEQLEQIVIDLAVSRNKKILELTVNDFKQEPTAALLLTKRGMSVEEISKLARNSLIQKIEKGAKVVSDTRFLHTEPHHDDLMLGCLPIIVRHIRNASNTHYFVCLTSGFTSVTNRYMRNQLSTLLNYINTATFAEMFTSGYFDPKNEIGRNRDVWQYLDGVAADNPDLKNEGIARRLLRNLIEIFEESDLANIKNRIPELEHYFQTQYPGKKDPQYIQRLKGMGREWEAECLWGYFGWSGANVMNLRLGFYTGDIFTTEPTVERDVIPVLDLLKKVQPDIVSVAFDPEASGPDTHYKVLQTLTEALKKHEQKSKRHDLKIWGYRNVWYRFHPSEANLFVPVSLNMFSIMHSAFMNSFISQKDASFPSYEHDGPFSELAQKIQVDQYQKIKICLGREWFYEHPSPLIRATRGLVFLKEMSLPEFYQSSRELRKALENE